MQITIFSNTVITMYLIMQENVDFMSRNAVWDIWDIIKLKWKKTGKSWKCWMLSKEHQFDMFVLIYCQLSKQHIPCILAEEKMVNRRNTKSAVLYQAIMSDQDIVCEKKAKVNLHWNCKATAFVLLFAQ